MKKQLMKTAVAVLMAAGVTAPVMAGELSGSASVASAYLWRGMDLGDGAAAVSGDLTYSVGGAYAGVWISSGDSALGNEYDYYVGYGAEVGGLGIDLSVWNYNYSDGTPSTAVVWNDLNTDGIVDAGELFAPGTVRDDTTGEFSEVILGLSFAGVDFTVYDNIAGGSGYEYYTLGYGFDSFSATVGYHDNVGGAEDLTHVDLGYAYNDNLSFTASKMLDDEADDDLIFVVSYSLPIE